MRPRTTITMPAAPSSAIPSRTLRSLYAAGVLGAAVLAILVSILSGRIGADWAETLALPSFAPSPGIGAVLGGIAHILLALGCYRVLCRPDWMPDRPRALRAFALQAVLALLWPPAFFIVQSPGAGLFLLLPLVGTRLAAWRVFGAIDRWAGGLALTAALWAGFEALVMLSIVIRN